MKDGLLRAEPRPGAGLSRLRGQRPREDRGRDRAGSSQAVTPGHVRQGGGRRAQGGDGHDRERVRGAHGPALRRGELYQGGEYHLYHYKKYTDVRLVFAPEQEIAFFGGDPDNFTYPRHDLDVCFFRAYENGRPAVPASFLPWSPPGHRRRRPRARARQPRELRRGRTPWPSSTPSATCCCPRSSSTSKPAPLAPSAPTRRRAPSRRGAPCPTPSSLENSKKAFDGRLSRSTTRRGWRRRPTRRRPSAPGSLADPALAAAHRRPLGPGRGGPPEVRRRGWTSGASCRSAAPALFTKAGQIVRLVAEVKKPNEMRLEEFADSGLPSLKNQLFSTAPLFDDLEETILTHQFAQAEAALGREPPLRGGGARGPDPRARPRTPSSRAAAQGRRRCAKAW